MQKQVLTFTLTRPDLFHARSTAALYKYLVEAVKKTGSEILVRFPHDRIDLPYEQIIQGDKGEYQNFMYAANLVERRQTISFKFKPPIVDQDYLTEFRERVTQIFETIVNF